MWLPYTARQHRQACLAQAGVHRGYVSGQRAAHLAIRFNSSSFSVQMPLRAPSIVPGMPSTEWKEVKGHR